jgi:hypothetical protein
MYSEITDYFTRYLVNMLLLFRSCLLVLPSTVFRSKESNPGSFEAQRKRVILLPYVIPA